MTTLTIVAMTLFLGYIAATTLLHGAVPESYSYLHYLWPKRERISVFSAVTFIVAFLMLPPMVEVGKGNALQVLGFFAPIYLIVVAAAPDYINGEGQRIAHIVGASLCAAASFLWLLLVTHLAWLVAIFLVIFGVVAYFTKSYREDYLLWAELVLFCSVFVALLIKL